MGRGTLLEVQDRSGDRLGDPGRVGIPSEVPERVERSSRGSGTVGRHSQGSGRGEDVLRKVRHGWGGPLEGLG